MLNTLKPSKIYNSYIYYLFSNKLKIHSIVVSALSINRVKSNLLHLKNDITSGLILQENDWDYCILDTLKDVTSLDIKNRKQHWVDNCINYFKTHRAVGLRSIANKKKQIVINRKNGLKIQEKMLKIAEKVFYIPHNVADKNIIKSLYEFSSWDWYQCGYFFECKSSNYYSYEYPCAILSCCKYDYYPHVMILFHFPDAMYYIKYDADLFSTFKTGYHKSRICVSSTWCLYIPITQLTKFDKKSRVLIEPINETDLIKEKKDKLLEEDIVLFSKNNLKIL